jgi:DNA repair photolyase
LHCYTFSSKFAGINSNDLSIDGIIDNIRREGKKINIIYVSGYRENFEIPSKGLSLVEQLFDEFNCDILFTTRNVFEHNDIIRISNLNKRMKDAGKLLFACVSISAYQSYKKMEPNNKIPTPEQRINFVRELYQENIITILTLRPVAPDSFIPTQEYLDVLEQLYNSCSAVISSGIYIDEDIQKRLKLPQYDCDEENWRCFNEMLMQKLKVETELKKIENACKAKKLPFFRESLPSVNFFYNKLIAKT